VRHEGENLDRRRWVVRGADRPTAIELVRAYHYTGGGSNTAAAVHGLYRRGDPLRCYGVAWWLRAIVGLARSVAREGEDWRGVASLSRLVIDPSVPRNGASFLLSQSMRLLPVGFTSLVTFADQRLGHSGAIYRATGWSDDGLTRGRRAWLDPETGRQVSEERFGRVPAERLRAQGLVQSEIHRKRRFIYRR